MRQLKSVLILWGGILASMGFVSLLLRVPPFNQLSATLTPGLQESLLLGIVLVFNAAWFQQPLHYRNVPISWTQFKPVLPTLLVTAFIASLALLSTRQWSTTFAALSVAVLISLFEETCFRGLLFQLCRSTWGVLPGALLSSVLFSLTHLLNLSHQTLTATLLQLAFTFVLGLLLCLVTVQTKSLFWAIIIHTANDFFSTMAPTIQLPGITTTAQFQIFEIIIMIILIVPLSVTIRGRADHPHH
ncbi:CPBP family intramembrane metalloprotease [Lactiplantibacillus pentosus]|uniref:CAAX family membrane-bound protease n=1 Tax=Lactiplantibacillus pentosus IG1 TaxID=1042160 RepID=G0M3S8_LACPE|nr:CPBP family intramembrane glutamic endopeptidase [Lactiplantibacillus pentosus]CCC16790.1 CAAX family membrane-bound protease [Lactiplantibacillus pentosus IG1]MCT3283279.1 CPBP family intramembrane metalloprotease [Lactiplantibacillus pentosus]MCT3302749.1 CPBP family intramembrane metalloprotease [Lactiplantibacillus pentosus]PRO80251.1 CPBP family intramembrane metalloprotease [Lactiplantibacillus pentosus]PRO83014.1 CPBP family intramembrane metalloprotease [Lactiplantibacillus pentosus